MMDRQSDGLPCVGDPPGADYESLFADAPDIEASENLHTKLWVWERSIARETSTLQDRYDANTTLVGAEYCTFKPTLAHVFQRVEPAYARPDYTNATIYSNNGPIDSSTGPELTLE